MNALSLAFQETLGRVDPPHRIDPPYRVDPKTLIDDPHAAFARLRPHHPILEIGQKQYLALRADDVLALLTDRRTKQVEGHDYVRLRGIPDGAASRFLTDFFLFTNADEHRAKRRLFARASGFAAIRAARGRIRAVADDIVAALPRGESIDFIDRMAARVPAEMIAAILGLPVSEAPYFASRVYDVARAFTPVYPIADHERIETAVSDLFAYIDDHLKARLQTPEDDVLSTLLADWQEDPMITYASLIHQVLGIIVGGSDTTRAAFAMLVTLLVRHPEHWDAVRAQPSLIPGAVAEALRYEPSVGSIARFTTQSVNIGGVVLPAGVLLSVSTLSAMRDPTLYRDPDRFDIHRTDHPRLHAVFGHGPHRCIGEMLARIEMEEGLAALTARVAYIEMETTPRMQGFGGIRQITLMRVRLH